jgi:hypothetical protein
MMKYLRLGLLLVILSSAAQAQAYSISGHVTNGTGLQLRYVFAIPTRLDTFFVTVCIPVLNSFTLSNMDSGGYVLVAYQDLNVNFIPDLNEPRGFYGGGTVPQVFELLHDSSGVDIALHPPSSGGFTGRIIYNGMQSGSMYVRAFHTPAMDGTLAGAGFVLDTTGNNNYTAFVDSFGTYYAMAFMDLNGNFSPDANEPQGIYGGQTPAAIEITTTHFPTNINITLLDPAAAPERRENLPEGMILSPVYPNPFNSNARTSFVLDHTAAIDLGLYDLLGRRVRSVAHGSFVPGEHEVVLDLRELPTGVYLLRLESGGVAVTRKVLLLK